MSELKTHSDQAWDIASHWSSVLASDTRTLASMIDAALLVARKTALEEAAVEIERLSAKLAEISRLCEDPVNYAAAFRKVRAATRRTGCPE